MAVEQISVFLENTPGHLNKVMEVLYQANVDIKALSVADTTNYGVLRLITDDTQSALTALKSAECTASITPVVGIHIENKPGALYRVTCLLRDNEINIEYLYAYLGKNTGEADIIMRVEDNEKAVKILTDNNIRLI